MMFGTMEGSNYIYAKQKAENTTANINLILNKQSRLTVEDIDMLIKSVPIMMRPIKMNEQNFGLVITSIQRDKPGKESYEKPYIYWQMSGGNVDLVKQRFSYSKGAGKEENKVNEGILRGYSFQEGDQIIHVDMVVKYKALLTFGYVQAAETEMKYDMFTRPRKGAFQFRPDEIE
jgi:hypothetical protein